MDTDRQHLPKFLVEELSSKEAIEYLMSLGSISANTYLAVNRNLSSEQIDRLLTWTGELERANRGPAFVAAILLASRIDLTPQHFRRIIEGKSVLMRQALLSRNLVNCSGSSALKISDDNFNYVLSAPWFTPDYGFTLRELAQLSKEQIARLPYEEVPGQQAHLERLAGLRESIYPKNKSYASRANEIRTHLGLKTDSLSNNSYTYASGYFKYRIPTGDNPGYDELVARSLDLPLEQLPQYFKLGGDFDSGATSPRVPADILARKVQKVIGEQGREFYTVLFDLFPAWHGSLNELIQMAQTLTLPKSS